MWPASRRPTPAAPCRSRPACGTQAGGSRCCTPSSYWIARMRPRTRAKTIADPPPTESGLTGSLHPYGFGRLRVVGRHDHAAVMRRDVHRLDVDPRVRDRPGHPAELSGLVGTPGNLANHRVGLALDLDPRPLEGLPRRRRILHQDVDDAAAFHADPADALDVHAGVAQRLAEARERPRSVLQRYREVLGHGPPPFRVWQRSTPLGPGRSIPLRKRLRPTARR